ncbi:MAG: hypothetical protein AVDCRST_MAG54-3310, partial [uncultured Actinomycetospora sp.]
WPRTRRTRTVTTPGPTRWPPPSPPRTRPPKRWSRRPP